MKINLREIKEYQKKKIDIALASDTFPDIDSEIILVSQVSGELVLEVEENIHLKGHLTYTLQLPCFMCDQQYFQEFNIDLEEYYEDAKSQPIQGKEIELNKRSIITFQATGGVIDINNLIRDYMITSIPMKMICNNCFNPEVKGGESHGSSQQKSNQKDHIAKTKHPENKQPKTD